MNYRANKLTALCDQVCNYICGFIVTRSINFPNKTPYIIFKKKENTRMTQTWTTKLIGPTIRKFFRVCASRYKSSRGVEFEVRGVKKMVASDEPGGKQKCLSGKSLATSARFPTFRPHATYFNQTFDKHSIIIWQIVGAKNLLNFNLVLFLYLYWTFIQGCWYILSSLTRTHANKRTEKL